MNSATEIKGAVDQDDRELKDRMQRLHTAILVKVCGDARLAEIIRVFEAGDPRRKETMWRMACALERVREIS